MKFEAPHLFLICVDALRADVLLPEASTWPSEWRPATPHLDRLRRESIRWTRAWASSAWTKPAVPSMLLSMHPSEHGVLEVGGDLKSASSASLPDDVPTLAEILSGAGYHTVGLAHNAQLDRALGFDRGYDVYTSDGGRAREIVARVAALAPWRTGPAFVHLHLIEPHWPFDEELADRAEPRAKGRFPFHQMRASEWKDLKARLKNDLTLTESEQEFLFYVYGLAVEQADRAIGELLHHLEQENVLEKSVVLFTADHGEELLDHGLVGHGQSLHDELTRIPLSIRVGGQTAVANAVNPAPRDIESELASHVDLVPTLAKLAGASLSHIVAGRDLLRDDPVPYVFSEVKHKRRYHQSVTDGRWKRIRTVRFERLPGGENHEDKNNLRQLFEGRPFQERRMLFDLENDPGETNDVSAARPEVAEELDAALERWWERRSLRDRDHRALEEELIRRLEALGYM